MITIYKTTTCAWCPMVMKYLDMKHVQYTVVNIDDDRELAKEVVAKSGAMTVPITVRGDWEAFVVGYQVGKLAELVRGFV